MKMTRRQCLGTLSGGMAMLAGAPVWTATELDIGDMTLTTLSDGTLFLPAGFIFEPVPEQIASTIRSDFGLEGETLSPPCNVTLLSRGEDVILFDCGSGPAFQPTVGQLPDALSAIGLSPEDVTHVVFTHGHPDHLWGLLDDFDDILFPNARLLMGATEFEYWSDPNTASTIGEARAAFAAGALRRIEAAGDRWELFADGDEVVSGVTARACFGHTPGHMAFRVGDTLIVGDAIGNNHIAFAAPGIETGNDQDMGSAAASRVSLLEEIVSDELTLVGFHLPDGGIGRSERAGDGYRYVAL